MGRYVRVNAWLTFSPGRIARPPTTSRRLLLAFDYDGTLALIAETPAQARMRAANRDLLFAVAHHCPCVVISGRSLDDVTSQSANVESAPPQPYETGA
jgi:trehalose-6-phosphatase